MLMDFQLALVKFLGPLWNMGLNLVVRDSCAYFFEGSYRVLGR